MRRGPRLSGIEKFGKPFEQLMEALERKRAAAIPKSTAFDDYD